MGQVLGRAAVSELSKTDLTKAGQAGVVWEGYITKQVSKGHIVSSASAASRHELSVCLIKVFVFIILTVIDQKERV